MTNQETPKPYSRNHLAAVLLAAEGWHVFPIRRGTKVPLTAHGFYDGTTNRQQIDAWWRAAPAAGVGIRTGHVSRLLVLDIDPRNGGDNMITALQAQFDVLPATPEVITGGGGRHLYFTLPTDVPTPGVTALWPGLDVKADGGYVVAPWTTHASGQEYQWAPGRSPKDLKPVPAPAWLLEALTARNADPWAYQDERPEIGELDRGTGALIIPAGKRNATLTSLAGTLHRKSVSTASILAACLAENTSKCQPPLPDHEVEAIVRSITSRYRPEPGEEVGEHVKPDRLQFAAILPMLSNDPPAIQWLLPQRLAFGDVGLLVGPAGVGKSWLALDMAVAGGMGLPIWGDARSARPLQTMIIDEENTQEEVHRRLRALVKAWQITPETLAARLWLANPCQGFSFRDPTYIRALHKRVAELRPDLIILDSTVAVSTMPDENDAVGVRRFFHDHLYPLRAIAGSTILCLHHANKAVYQKQRMVEDAGLIRGSSDFAAAADAAMVILPLGDGRFTVKSVKVRRGRPARAVVMSIVDGQGGGARPLVMRRDDGDLQSPPTLADRVERLFIQSPEPKTATQVLTLLRVSDPNIADKSVRNVLSKLVANGTLGHATNQYQLVSDPAGIPRKSIPTCRPPATP